MPAAIDLPSEGRALARGETVRARRHGPPDLGRARSVEDALVAAIGHLTEVMLHHAPLCRIEAGPNGVHQMRVALRRLRSVLKAFRPAAACDAVEAFDLSLKTLAQTLGDARDLDVFLLGIGTRVSAAMPGERRIATLLRAMEARRAGAYQALRAMLEGQQFRALMLDGIALMLERPWSAAALDRPDQAELLAERLPDFASRLLDKRWHRLCSEGEAIETMDEEALHELRLSTKRLRYAAELFAPIWPGKPCKRFLSRLAAVQEEFGLANDAAVARGIVAALGTSVPAWAVGVIEGFSAARAGSARRKGYSAWKDLMAAKPFWSEL
jgi:CHAD domain-containing protein